MKTVLISGAEVKDRFLGNRGAEQLLRTAAGRLRSMGIRPAVVWGQVDSALVSELGLREYIGNPRTSSFDRLVPKFETDHYVSLHGLDGVLDASGFALGDAWGLHTATWLERKYRQWRARGIPVIALPQAYGSFEKPGVKEKAKQALTHCSLVYPRDDVSNGHLVELKLGSRLGEVTPDITIGEPFQVVGSRSKRLVLVPNWNLKERGNSSAYLDVLDKTVRIASERGYEVVGLLHEGSRDLAVLNELPSRSLMRIEASMTGWATKSFIGSSEVVVAGRYHAVLAALTTGTPVVTHSWSHKYQAALELFDASSWLCDPTDTNAVVPALERVLSTNSVESMTAGKLEAGLRVDRMWTQVAQLLTCTPPDVTSP